jgi:hypothetical protein
MPCMRARTGCPTRASPPSAIGRRLPASQSPRSRGRPRSARSRTHQRRCPGSEAFATQAPLGCTGHATCSHHHRRGPPRTHQRTLARHALVRGRQRPPRCGQTPDPRPYQGGSGWRGAAQRRGQGSPPETRSPDATALCGRPRRRRRGRADVRRGTSLGGRQKARRSCWDRRRGPEEGGDTLHSQWRAHEGSWLT